MNNHISIDEEIMQIKNVMRKEVNEILSTLFKKDNMGVAAIGDCNIDEIIYIVNTI